MQLSSAQNIQIIREVLQRGVRVAGNERKKEGIRRGKTGWGWDWKVCAETNRVGRWARKIRDKAANNLRFEISQNFVSGQSFPLFLSLLVYLAKNNLHLSTAKELIIFNEKSSSRLFNHYYYYCSRLIPNNKRKWRWSTTSAEGF